MSYSLLWLPDVLKTAGLKISPVDGWQFRGDGEMGQVCGVICHHTAGAKILNMPSLGILIKGRDKIPGPLAHLGLGRDGTFYIIAAGRCNHAGTGSWNGINAGNSHFIGIEAENTGLGDDPWPDVQMNAYRYGVAAILAFVKRGPLWCAGHKEYAPSRKIDPSFDMAAFRAAVAEIDTAVPVAPIPVSIPATGPGTVAHKTLRRPMQDAEVLELKRKLGISGDDVFDPATEAAVRAFQRSNHLVPDGIVGPRTWAAFT